MRWFKHITTTRSDEKIGRLFDRLGVEGYGIYWCILEEIARNLEGNSPTFLQLSAKNWGKTCGISGKKFEKFSRILQEISIFSVEFFENEIRIDCPNLLKYRDEWTRRKTKTPESLRSHSGDTPGRTEQSRTEQKKKQNRTDKKLGFSSVKIPPPLCSSERFLSCWKDWIAHRDELKKKMTATQATKLLKKLSRHSVKAACDAIDNSIANGWQGLFPKDEPEPEITAQDAARIAAEDRAEEIAAEIERRNREQDAKRGD